MSCPTCGNKMSLQHQYQETAYLWCPNCGTLASQVGKSIVRRNVPRLVEGLIHAGQNIVKADEILGKPHYSKAKGTP